jgi:hypothetical protein
MPTTLVRALQDPALYDHPVERFEVVETHISWVLLTGRYAYKIKKPVNFGFVDFSTLDKRRFFSTKNFGSTDGWRRRGISTWCRSPERSSAHAGADRGRPSSMR